MNTKTDKQLMNLYQKYSSLDHAEFVQYCSQLIQKANVPNLDILKYLKTCHNKDYALKKTSDFLMKGTGFGVIKI